MPKQKKYQLFDGSDKRYPLGVTSNANIRRVCEVLTRCHSLPDQARVYYAKHGGIDPQNKEDGEEATYNFKNIFDEVTVWMALAEALFIEAPALLEVDEEEATVHLLEDMEAQADSLIRSEVMRGRDDFLGKFGMSPYEVRSLLNVLESGRIPANIGDLSLPDQIQAGMSET